MLQVFKENKALPITKVKLLEVGMVDKFNEGAMIKISGLSKGKGFQGVVKRYRFKGASKTHGTKHALRQPGSIGATWPQRVIKGKRMAGRMGGERITLKNKEILNINKEQGELMIKGSLPGNRGSLLEIRI